MRGYLEFVADMLQCICLAIDDRQIVVQTTGANVRKRNIKIDFTLADLVGPEVWIRRNPAVGDEITSRDFDPKEQKMALAIASEQLVLEMVNIVGGLGGGGVDSPGLGLVQEVIDVMEELRAGLGYFGDHISRVLYRDAVKDRALDLGRVAVYRAISIAALARKGPPRGDARGDGFGGKDVRRISSGVGPRMAVAVSSGRMRH